MDIPMLTLPKTEAAAKFREYRDAVRRRHSEEDEAVRVMYRELYRGRPVIDCLQAFNACGHDVSLRPMLALGRADWPHVFFTTSSWKGEVYFGKRQPRRGSQSRLVFRRADFDWDICKANGGRAVTPIIPPALRPAGGLENYWILWEAAWHNVPRDPFLLKHLHGHIYAVLAQWDLTEVERLVLGTRPVA